MLKDKKGAAEFVWKVLTILLSVICVLALIFIAYKIYSVVNHTSATKQAQAHMDELEIKIKELVQQGNGAIFDGYLVLGPKGWRFITFDKDDPKPKQCKKDYCFCICDGENADDCNKAGVCKDTDKRVSLSFAGFGDKSFEILEHMASLGVRIVNEEERIVIGDPDYAPIGSKPDFIFDDNYFSYPQSTSPDAVHRELDDSKMKNLLEEDNVPTTSGFIRGAISPSESYNINPLVALAIIKIKYNNVEDAVKNNKQDEIDYAKNLGVDCAEKGLATLSLCIGKTLEEGFDGKADADGFKAGVEKEINGKKFTPDNKASAVLYWYTRDYDKAIEIAQKVSVYRDFYNS
ncbi:MAG: hypothetical protein ABIE22_04510 [archaeon]